MHTVVHPLLCLSIHLLYHQQDFFPITYLLSISCHMSYGRAVLWTQSKGSSATHQICLFLHGLKQNSKSYRVLFWYVIVSTSPFWWSGPWGKGSMKGSCQIIPRSQWPQVCWMNWARDSVGPWPSQAWDVGIIYFLTVYCLRMKTAVLHS